MGLKCDECGAKIRDDSEVCPKCGYRLYKSEFEGIADEVEREMSEVSSDDLLRVFKERPRNGEKLSLREFELVYIAKNKIRKPFGNLILMMLYEKKLKKAYREYIEELEI